MRILVLLGTRPEIIRLAAVIEVLRDACTLKVCHTGQNYDPSLSEIFFRELGLQSPDYYLNASGASFGSFLGGIFVRLEEVLNDAMPDAVVVLGDTNSALGAIVAARRGIPIYHLEAGNRSFDARVPEETNRRLLDHLADFNLAYTEHARRNLLREGIAPRAIGVIGSPLREVFERYRDQLDDEKACASAKVIAGEYILVSLHRQENVDTDHHLQGLLKGCQLLAESLDVPVLVSAHPRFRSRIAKCGVPKEWTLSTPFGYFQYLSLQRQARLVISDSGSVGEEAAILGFPAVSPRWSMERPEALETGAVVLATTDGEHLHSVGKAVVASWESGVRPSCPTEYQIEDTSRRVLSFMLSTSRVAAFWGGKSGPE